MKDRNYKICFRWNINISKSVDDHNYHFGNVYMFIIILINYLIVCGICKKYHVCRYCCKGPVTHKNLTRIYEEFCILLEFFSNFTCISMKYFLEKFGKNVFFLMFRILQACSSNQINLIWRLMLKNFKRLKYSKRSNRHQK